MFAPLSDYILTGHESGKVAKYDVKTGEQVAKVEESHSGEITDIQLSPDGTYFITSSKDKSAKVSRIDSRLIPRFATRADDKIFDVETLDEMKSYTTETPLNSACIAPLRPYVRAPPL